jgi:hypothetical protein
MPRSQPDLGKLNPLRLVEKFPGKCTLFVTNARSVCKEIYMDESMGRAHYRRLLLMAALSFVAMYILMYAMVGTFANVYSNINQFYMAGLMTAPMIIIELAMMGAMYRDKRRNAIIVALSAIALIAFWVGIRQQLLVSDAQFVRSMIPHHAGAILMCQETVLRDPELKELCNGIVAGQQSEIDQMKRILTRLP